MKTPSGLKKILQSRWTYIVCIVLALAIVVSGVTGYLVEISQSLSDHASDEVLEVTAQLAKAFYVFSNENADTLKTVAEDLSKFSSENTEDIQRTTHFLGNSVIVYIITDIDGKKMYTNLDDNVTDVDAEDLEAYAQLEESGLRGPYLNEYTGERTISYYQQFTFADGHSGLVQAARLVSNMAKWFSAEFYNGEGFPYIVDNNGEIILRCRHKNSNHTYTNLFDIISQENSDEAAEKFIDAIGHDTTGVTTLIFNGERHIFAFIPIEGVDNWNVISIVPDRVINAQTQKVLKTTNIFLIVFGSAVLLVLVFLLYARQSRANIKVRDQEIQYRQLLFDLLTNNSSDVYMMLTPATLTVEYVSPNIEKVLGLTVEEVKKDLTLLEQSNYKNNAKITRDSLILIKEDEPIVVESERINKRTGEPRWFTETIYRAKAGQSDKFIVTLSDRTTEYHNQQVLQEALDVAKSANQSKSNFLSNMSHDIRTPMNAIVGLCTLLQRDATNEERVREYTKKITSSSEHLLGLINDILDMSKIEAGKMTTTISEFNLAEMIMEIEDIIRPQTKAKKQTFTVSVSNIRSERLLGDKLRVNQVLINILSNAVKYTPEDGHISFEVRQLQHASREFAHLRFVVQDDGIGMSEEYIKKLFDPFTREINSTVNKIQGTGLGMAITKSLIDLMGGTINVESVSGQGSTFTVDIEFRLQKNDEDEEFWATHNISNILIVQQHLTACKNIVTMLHNSGIDAEYAQTEVDALARIEEALKLHKPFDCVVLDHSIPNFDVFGAAKEFRPLLTDDALILLVTSHEWEKLEKQAHQSGIDGYISKPFFLTNLKIAVEKLRINRDTAPKEEVSALKGLHFLAAEDNPINAEVLAELLDMEGATVEIAENGQLVLENFISCQPGTYAMILMDVQMPVMNGYEAAQAIRQSDHPEAKTIPIIAMTANAFAEDVKNALDSGMNAHIAKPLDIAKLNTTVKSLINNQLSITPDADKRKKNN